MSYVVSNTPLTTGDTVTVTYFLNSATTLTNLVTVITIPAGAAYVLLSANVSTGTFDETDQWDVPTLTGGQEETLELEFEITDIDAFEAGTKNFVGTTAAVAGEVVLFNNVANNVIGELTCPEVAGCADLLFVHLEGDEEIDGEKTFLVAPIVPDDPYDSVGWDGNNEVATKNSIRDIIESLVLSIVPDADYGDITVTAGVWEIEDEAVDFAAMQDIATDRLLGRDTAGTGSVEELTVSGGIEFTGAGGIQTSAFSGDVTKSAGGTTTTIANDSVTNAKLANMATDTIKGRDTAGTGDPEDLTLNTTLVFTGAGSIGRAGIGGDVVIAAGSNSALIPNDTVTYAKMQNVSATDRVLGRVSGGAGDVEEIVFTDQAQQLADDTSFADMRVTLGVEIGIDVQASDATLDALAAYNTNGLLTQTAGDTFTGRTITGTANEITVSQGDGVAGNPTISLPTTIDLGGKTSLEIPNSAAPVVDADGEIAVDTTVADFSHGLIKFFGGEEQFVLSLPIAEATTPVDGAVPTYNATDDEFQLVAPTQPLAIYEAILAQTGTGTPTQTVLVTSFGSAMVHSYLDPGEYEFGFPGAFPVGKTSIQITLGLDATATDVKASRANDDKIVFNTFDPAGVAAELEGTLTITVKVWP